LVLLALAALPVFAQLGRVEGRVVTVDGKAVPKATVRLTARITSGATNGQQPPVYVEVTSSDGRFIVENVAPGTYTLNAQRSGYSVPTSLALRAPTVTVASGETRSGVEFKMVQLAIVGGIVADAEGDPVQGVTVRLLRYMYSQGRLTLQPAAAGSTDDRGQFRILSVAEGRYYLAASANPTPASGLATEIRGRSALESNQTTYYPNSGTLDGAIKLDIKSGSLETFQIRMRRGIGYSIRGTVGLPAGATNPAQIQLFPKGEDFNGQTFGASVRPDGVFEAPSVPPGSYTIFVRYNMPAVPPNQPKAFSGRAEVTVSSGNVDNVSIRLVEAAEVTGHIAMEDGKSLMDSLPSLPANRPANGPNLPASARMPQVILQTAETMPASTSQGQTSQEGTFRIANVTAGKYMLIINNPPPGSYVKSVRMGGQDVTHSLLDLSSGSGGSLDIVLSSKAASLSLTVPASLTQGAQITLWPVIPDRSSQTGRVMTTTVSNQPGPPRLQGIAPDDYYVAAWEEGPPQEYARVPEFLARFNDQAAKVTLKESETGTVEPRVISREAMQKVLADFP
jgi:hypothetical protein